MHIVLSVSLAVGVTLLTACGEGGGGGGGSPPNVGTLIVNINVPGSASASVAVSGPDGYSQALTGTATLTGLAPGSYTVSAAPTRVSGAVVDTVYDGAVTGSPAAVSKDATATTSVTYALRTGSGHLWVTDSNRQEIQGYTPDQLAASGTPTPDVAIGTGGSTQTYDLSVTSEGALWVALPSQNELVRYAPTQLATSGIPTPAATLSVGLVDWGILDRSGNLWVDLSPPSSGAPSILRFEAAELAGTGALSGTAALTWVLPTAGYTAKMAFDAAGNLWILNSGDGGSHFAQILRADASSLGATGSPTFSPGATITSSHVFYVQGCAFDADGALWIAVLNQSGSSPGVNLVRYSNSQLAINGTQSVDPEAVITVSGAKSLGSIAFDASGNLWIADYEGRTLFRLLRTTIVGSGSFTAMPDIIVNTPSGTVSGLTGLAFDPPPANLPLAQ